MYILKVEDLNVRVGDPKVLEDIDLTLKIREPIIYYSDPTALGIPH